MFRKNRRASKDFYHRLAYFASFTRTPRDFMRFYRDAQTTPSDIKTFEMFKNVTHLIVSIVDSLPNWFIGRYMDWLNDCAIDRLIRLLMGLAIGGFLDRWAGWFVRRRVVDLLIGALTGSLRLIGCCNGRFDDWGDDGSDGCPLTDSPILRLNERVVDLFIRWRLGRFFWVGS